MVTDAGGKPVPFVRITLTGDTMAPATVTVFTDATGKFKAPDVNVAYDAKKISIESFRIGFEETSRKAALSSDGKDLNLKITVKGIKNVAHQVPASAWIPGKPGDRPFHILINECAGCHQLGAQRVKDLAVTLDGLPFEDRVNTWASVVQFMRGATLEWPKGAHGERRFRWGLSEDDPIYKAVLEPASSFFLPRDEAVVVPYLAKNFPTKFDTMTNYDDVKRLGEYGVTSKTVVEEYQLPTFGWTREVTILPGSPYVWFNELDRDRLGRLDPKDGSIKWYAVPGNGPQGPHTLNADADGNLWVALEESYSIGKFDPRTEKWTVFPPPPGVNFAITHDTAFNSRRQIQTDPNGKIWLTLVGLNELWSVDTKTSAVERHAVPMAEGEKPFHSFIYGSIMEPDGKHVWWTQLHGFLGSTNTETGNVERIIPFPRGAAPRRMAIQEDGTLWVPLNGDGQLVKVDPERGEIVKTYDLPDRASATYSITWDPRRKVVWVGTTNSDRIYRFDPASEKWTHYPLPRKEAFIRMIEIDHDTGDLWTTYANLPIGPRDPEKYERVGENNMIVRIHPGD